MEVTIRPMAVEDIPQVHEIDVRSFPLAWSERSYLFEVRENQSSRCWVAEVEEDGRRLVAGMLVLWLLVDEAHIGTIAVHPDYRQHRIGQRLLAAGLLDVHSSGAQKSFLEVRRSNAAAQALYRRFGYEIAGVRPRYYRDNGEDAFLMNLDNLDPARLRQLLVPVRE